MITTDWKKVFFAANRRLSQLLEKLGRPGMINAPAQPVATSVAGRRRRDMAFEK
jgi:hypothetical protein